MKHQYDYKAQNNDYIKEQYKISKKKEGALESLNDETIDFFLGNKGAITNGKLIKVKRTTTELLDDLPPGMKGVAGMGGRR